MNVSIQTNKLKKQIRQRENSSEEDEESISEEDDAVQDKKIKRLTHLNRQLIQKLKKQNDQLTKKINKHKFRPARSTSIRSSPKNPKELQSKKKQLANAYKQIDMYKSILTGLKAKQVSIQSVDKVKQLENRIKEQDNLIDHLQKEIKYIGNIREQQEKQLKIFENEDVKQSIKQLEKQVKGLKQKLKTMKKNGQKRDQYEKKQQAYQIELQIALRKMNDEYYPGKEEKKEASPDDAQITEREWQIVKGQLTQKKKKHEETTKKIEHLKRQKNRELKSAQENELKIKQKSRKLHTLRNKVAQLSKLATAREGNKRQKKRQDDLIGQSNANLFNKNSVEQKYEGRRDQKKNQNDREVKKWMIPQGYCLQKGKILPDSIFFSDKTILKDSKKTKIRKVNIWANQEEIPNVIQFFYQNQLQQQIEGLQPMSDLPTSLELSTMKLKEGDYIDKIKVVFLHGQLIGIQILSKFGKQLKIEGQAANQGESFTFQPRPNEIPCLVFGAYVRKEQQVRLCHMGVQFIRDW